MVKMTERRLASLLVLFGLVVIGLTQCPLPTANQINERLQAIVRSTGAEGATAVTTLHGHHFTCQALDDTAGDFRSLSIVVNYTVVGTTGNRVRQIQLRCTGSTYDSDDIGTTPIDTSPPAGLFDTTTRRHCRLCTHLSPSTTNYDSFTNCLNCTTTCLSTGQGACTNTAGTTCCPFYDTNDMCTTTCPAEFVSTNYTCDVCLAQGPCQNGGTCSTSDGMNYTCSCLPMFTGTNCTACIMQCMNGGTPNADCSACVCASGFTGASCETEIRGCDSNPCQNGGTCVNQAGQDYMCSCSSRWGGTNCDTCSIENCRRCDTSVSPPVCTECEDGFSGDTCVSLCTPNPCMNGGTCSARGDAFQCECAPGWSSTNCTECAMGYTMTTGNECVPCRDQFCTQCANSPDQCDACDEGYRLEDRQCISTGFPVGAIIGIIVAIIAILVIVITSIVVGLFLAKKQNAKKTAPQSAFDKAGAVVTDNKLYMAASTVTSS